MAEEPLEWDTDSVVVNETLKLSRSQPLLNPNINLNNYSGPLPLLEPGVVHLLDLLPGNRFRSLGLEFVITGMDKNTKDYIEKNYQIQIDDNYINNSSDIPNMSKELGAQYSTGLGGSLQLIENLIEGSKNPSLKKNYNSCSTNYLQKKEMLLKTKSFLEYDGLVLRFLTIEVKNPSPPYFPALENEVKTRGENFENITNGHGFLVDATAKRYALSYYLSSKQIDIVLNRYNETIKSMTPSGTICHSLNHNFEESSEIKSPHGSNSFSNNNVDEPKLLFKKSKLAKNWREVQRGKEPQYYAPIDLLCGKVIDVCGRYFLLIDCDSYTRSYYQEYHLHKNSSSPNLYSSLSNSPSSPSFGGFNSNSQSFLLNTIEYDDKHEPYSIEQVPVTLVEPKTVEIVQPIPQLGDGFLAIGSEEDTLATVFGQPKVTRNIKKRNRNQGQILRCKALLMNENKNKERLDQGFKRYFYITYYLEDDTIQVFEETSRNSGYWGGNFLKRGKYVKDDESKVSIPFSPNSLRISTTLNSTFSSSPKKLNYFQPNDIVLGNTLHLNGNEFLIVELDNLTLKFCETYPDEFPSSNTSRIVESLLKKIMNSNLQIRDVFMKADVQNLNFLDSKVFLDLLSQLNLTEGLNQQELLTLLRRFSDPIQTSSSSSISTSATSSTSRPSTSPLSRQNTSTSMASQQSEFSGIALHNISKIYYHELADLASHLYFIHYKKGRPNFEQRNSLFNRGTNQEEENKQEEENNFFTFLISARSRNIQWRKLVRKNPANILNKYCQFSKLMKIFASYDFFMRPETEKLLISRYAVSKESNEFNIIKNYLEKNKKPTFSNYKLLSKYGKKSPPPLDLDQELEQDPIVDYSKLCNDIYTCDW